MLQREMSVFEIILFTNKHLKIEQFFMNSIHFIVVMDR